MRIFLSRVFTPLTVVATVLALSGPLFSTVSNAGEVVIQSERRVPVAHEVDLLVVGGSTGGIAAACEASRAGAKVLLITSYPYLGEDRTATLRLGGEAAENRDDPLHEILMKDEQRDNDPTGMLRERVRRAEKLPFTYAVEEKIDPSHPETAAPGRLADGIFGNPVTDSLQINGDATITVDLGQKKAFRQIVLLAYLREKGDKPFEVDRVECSLSDDGKNWVTVEQVFQGTAFKGGSPDGGLVPFVMSAATPLEGRYLKLRVFKKASAARILLGQLVVLPKPLDEVPAQAEDDKELELPRPMHVKRTLDNALLRADVPFLFNTYLAGDVVDDAGKCFGAVISNRSGRQVILARKILDARSKPTSLDTAQFVTIGAAAREIDLKDYPLLKSVAAEYRGKPYLAPRNAPTESGLSNQYPVVNYTFEIDVPAGQRTTDPGFRAEVEKQIRLATYSPDQAFTADEVYYPQEFRPLSDWRKQGRNLAAEAKTVVFPDRNRLSVSKTTVAGVFQTTNPAAADQTGKTVSGDIREILGGLRSDALGFKGGTEDKTSGIRDPQRPLPVLGKYDVVVVGGGTSGAPAGISAGRQGARTLVLEHLHDLGGIGTAGAISVYWYGNVTGFTKEVQDGLRRWSIESKIHWWRSWLAEAGTDVWYGVLAGGALVDGERVKGVLVVTPFGPGIIEADVVIDATGNADIAVAAGAAIQSYDDKEIAVQGAGLAPRNLGASYTNTDFMFVDDNDVVDSSHVFVYAKEKYPQAFDQGKLLSTRERRQILGEFSFTVLDQVNNRTYPDSIVLGYSDYDTHGYTVDPYMELNHPYHIVTKADGKRDRADRLYAYVPYRSSIPKGLDGILVVGLAMSSHRDALPIVRMQPDLQNQGYAIGRAAAMLAKEPEKNVRDLDVRTLQRHLVEIGNLSEDVLAHQDNYGRTRDKVEDAVCALPDRFRESVPVVMWYPEEARPLVRKSYLDEKDFERKLVFAKVAAGLGDPVGVPTILKKLASYDTWDKGWEFTGMGQAGAATSPMDQWIMMLGRTGDPQAVEEIVAKAKLLTPQSEFSHFRAVALALEGLGTATLQVEGGRHEEVRGKAAQALADLLNMPGMTGYVHDSIEKAKRFDELGGRTNTNQEKSRRDSLIEISLARALYRCGDVDGKGETILRQYTKDLRGYFSRHAREVLEGQNPGSSRPF